jgi:exodeoxyribonuclease VIII
MSLKHIMLDLETLGTSPYSTIIMIGACVFDPCAIVQSAVVTDRFEVAIDPAQSAGLRMDATTVLWWMDAGRDEARKVWLGKPKVPLREALDGFADWLMSHKASGVRIWGNGSDFDNALLHQAYEVAQRDAPWSFRHNRCFRTLRSLLALEEGHYLGTAHTALADAENQAIRANQIIRKLGITPT